ncbi:l1 transposable element-related [Holotrichia oblita]|uniref:L1 transposable element-related n=1 Tax=Holotrichia oblita TaxID=644536 RepID=A0ACB9T445_HOLOL|nr:l1 transposable element-related [Holotrichia oblita]
MVLSRSQVAEYEEVIIEAFKKESFVVAISATISAVIEKQMAIIINKYEGTISNLTQELTNVKAENKSLLRECNERIDGLEQYSRRNNLRFFRVEEKDKEDVEAVVEGLISNKLGININQNYIELCHRIGPKINNKCRPIIVKFFSRKYKAEVFRHKTKLKGTKILIKEDFTKIRAAAVKSLISKHGHNMVWTSNGDIFFKDDTGVHKHKIY